MKSLYIHRIIACGAILFAFSQPALAQNITPLIHSDVWHFVSNRQGKTNPATSSGPFRALSTIKPKNESLFLHLYPKSPDLKQSLLSELAYVNTDIAKTSDKKYIEVKWPIKDISSLENYSSLGMVRLAKYMKPYAIEGEQVALLNVEKIHDSLGDGSGVKVGIIDLGFEGYDDLLGSELPSSVVTRDFTEDGLENGEIHGTAVAEIVHEMAPEADLYFYSIYTTTQIDQAVDHAIEDGVNIINMSLGSAFTSFSDGTGELEAITRKAKDAGILTVVSAGNEGDVHYLSEFREEVYVNDQVFESDEAHRFHRFSDYGSDFDNILNSMRTYSNVPLFVELIWDGNFEGNEDTDYSIYLWKKSSGGDYTLLGHTFDRQWGSDFDFPYEYIAYYPPYYDESEIELAVSIRHISGEKVPFRFFVYYASYMEHSTPEGSLPQPADSPHVLTVGAVDYSNWSVVDQLSDYSSRGPTWDARIKPDLVAPTAMETHSYEVFSGTSSSSPTVAGMAALYWSAINYPDADTVAAMLTNYAYDFEGMPGVDSDSGYGRVADFLPVYPSVFSDDYLRSPVFSSNEIFYSPKNIQAFGLVLVSNISTDVLLFSNSLSNLTELDENIVITNAPVPGGRIHYTVLLSNQSGKTASSFWRTERLYDIDAPASIAITEEPTGTTNRFLKFKWSSSSDSTSSNIFYQLEYCVDGDCALYSDMTNGQTELVLEVAQDEALVQARVRALDEANNSSAWSEWSDEVRIDDRFSRTILDNELTMSPGSYVNLTTAESQARVFYTWTSPGSTPYSFTPYVDGFIAGDNFNDTSSELHFYSIDAVGNVERTNSHLINFVIEMEGQNRPLNNVVSIEHPVLTVHFASKGEYFYYIYDHAGRKSQRLRLGLNYDDSIVAIDLRETEMRLEPGVYTLFFENEGLESLKYFVGE